MYLLNRIAEGITQNEDTDLHSTMYLLNPLLNFYDYAMITNLHSTMYLLNRRARQFAHNLRKFTFHYVSIKSSTHRTADLQAMNLHSTMYLLNRI